MIPEYLFRQIMDEITSDDDEQKANGAGGIGDVVTGLDLSQANAFAKVLAERAAAEPDDYVQEEFLGGIIELITEHDIDIATLEPVFQIPPDQLCKNNAEYVHDFHEYRDLYTRSAARRAGRDQVVEDRTTPHRRSGPLAVVDPKRVYVFPTEALNRARLTTLMQEVGVDAIGRFAVPFLPEDSSCDPTLCGDLGLEFGCAGAGDTLAELTGQEVNIWGAVLGYEVVSDARCPHRLWLCVPDTVAILLNPLVDLMRLQDDYADSPVLAEMLDDDLRAQLAKTPTVDDVSRIQLAATGVPADAVGDYLAYLASIAKEVPGRTGMHYAERGTPYDATWSDEKSLRTRLHHGSFEARCDSRLRRLYHPHGDHVLGIDLRECTTVSTHYERGLPREVSGDWVATPDMEVRVQWSGYSAHPPRVVDRPKHTEREIALGDLLLLEDGQDVIGEVVERTIYANPYTADRFWFLTVRLTPSDHSHFLSTGVLAPINCPCTKPFESLHPGDMVVVPQAVWVAEVSPSTVGRSSVLPPMDLPDDN